MKIYKNTPDANSVMVMALVRKLLIDVDRGSEWPAIEKRMRSGNYENLCAIAEEVTYGSIKVVDPE